MKINWLTAMTSVCHVRIVCLLHLPNFLHPRNSRRVAQGQTELPLLFPLQRSLSFVQKRDLSAEGAAARGLWGDGKCETIPSTPVTRRIRLPPLWMIVPAVFPFIQVMVPGFQSLLARTLWMSMGPQALSWSRLFIPHTFILPALLYLQLHKNVNELISSCFRSDRL